MQIFLTGATGLLGKNLLQVILKDKKNEVFILVRDLKKIDSIFQNSKRVHIFLGDITKSNFNLSEKDYLCLINFIDCIYHCAALTSFNATFEMLSEVNIIGTRNILTFAAQCKKLSVFHYISSAFIAGGHDGSFSENDFNLSQKFNNDYEKSKYEAEMLVRKSVGGVFKVIIYRPGVIIGDEYGQFPHKNNLLYLIFKLISLEKFSILPISLSASINVLPANVVAEAIYVLRHNNDNIFHVVNPLHFSLCRIIEEGCKKFNYVVPKFVSSCNIKKLTPLENKLLQPFLPYLFLKTSFDSLMTVNFLAKNNYQYPSITMDKILGIIN